MDNEFFNVSNRSKNVQCVLDVVGVSKRCKNLPIFQREFFNMSVVTKKYENHTNRAVCMEIGSGA